MYVATSLVVAGLVLVAPLGSPLGAPSVVTAAPARQQAPPRATPRTPARDRGEPAHGSGTIRGRVLSADTREPLRRARVSLSGTALRISRSVATDLEGRYEFQRVPNGRVTVSASKTGYVTLGFGQRRAFQAGRPLELAEGQTLDNVDFALPRGGVISGRIFNDLDEPASGISVVAQRLRFVNGQRDLVPAGRGSQTDDLGQYRISSLPPGSYYVGTLGGSLTPQSTVTEHGFVLAPTYHPAATNTAEARQVSLRVGQEVSGIDITLVASRASSISGTIWDSRGRPATGAALTVRPAGAGLLSASRTSFGAQSNATFSVPGLTPGTYVLHAVTTRPDAAGQESADLSITVGDQDVEGISVTTAPNGSLRGRVIFDGDVTPAFSPSSLTISAGTSRLGQRAAAQVGAGWNFEVKNVEPARVTVGLESVPAGWALKSVTSEGREVSETGLEVRSGAPSQVVVTLTNKPAVVTGTVQAQAGAGPTDDYTVVIFSDDAAHWKEGSRRLATARADQHGTYKVTGLPPGGYRIVALEYLDDGEEWNPDFLGWAQPRAIAVRLAEGETVSLNLKITRYVE